MPEARIRVAPLHLAALSPCSPRSLSPETKKSSNASRAPRRRTPPYVHARLQQLALPPVASKSSSTIVAADKKRRTNPCKYCIHHRARQKISVYGRTLV